MYDTNNPSVNSLARCLGRLEKLLRNDCDNNALCSQISIALQRQFAIQFCGLLVLEHTPKLHLAGTDTTLVSDAALHLSSEWQDLITRLRQSDQNNLPFSLSDVALNELDGKRTHHAKALATPIYAEDQLWGVLIVCPSRQATSSHDLQWFLYSLSEKLSRLLHPTGHDLLQQAWSRALHSLPQLVCLLDGNGRILHTNQQMARWSDTPQHLTYGVNLHQLLHPKCDDAHCNLAQACSPAQLGIGSGRTLLCEHKGLNFRRQLLVRIQTLDVADATPGNYAAVVEDITAGETLLSAWHNQYARRKTDVIETSAPPSLHRPLNDPTHNRQQALEKHNQLSSQLIEAQEAERRRIASELHDSIGQSLSSIKFNLEYWLGNATKNAPGDLDLSPVVNQCEQIKASINELRSIAMALHPAMLDNLGLLVTLDWCCREFQETHPGLSLYKAISVTEDEIPQSAKLAIYRIIQEALTNIAKHACASQISVHLRSSQGQIKLTVNDNGRGFERRNSKKMDGLGLTSMRERAEQLHGTFHLETRPGGGTTLQVLLPKEEEARVK